MRKLALALSTFGFIAFAGMAHADQKTENTEKTDTSTTLTGKQKTKHVKKVERADGSGMETTTETTRPKSEVKRDHEMTRDEATPVRDDGDANAKVKTEEHTTLTGKKQIRTTKDVKNADGSETETTTTRTLPKENHDK